MFPDFNSGHYGSLRARKAPYSEVNESAVQFDWSSRPVEDEDENSNKMQNLKELPLHMGLKKAIRYNMLLLCFYEEVNKNVAVYIVVCLSGRCSRCESPLCLVGVPGVSATRSPFSGFVRTWRVSHLYSSSGGSPCTRLEVKKRHTD